MTALDRTAEFREAVQQRERSYPPAQKRQRVKFGVHRSGRDHDDKDSDDPWTKQADQVATNLRSFANFLTSIRRAYLDLGASSTLQHPPKRNLDSTKGLAAWEGVRWLTDKERDEIDFAVKVALRKSVDRVRQLEQLEKVRIARLEAEKRDNPPGGALSRLLGLAVSPDDAASAAASADALAQHRSLVTFYLNALLADVSQRQRDQQELRVKRQLEKAESLGGIGAQAGPFGTGLNGGEGAPLASGSKGAAGLPPPVPSTSGDAYSSAAGAAYTYTGDDDDEIDNPLGSTLTAEQVQQFEAEESALLKATQTDLEALHKAESSLLEIATLQTQLVSHLTQQSELTDQLWEDAITVSGEVDRGNTQLKKAKERSRDSRMWLLVFLFGSSFTLLFLDYYT